MYNNLVQSCFDSCVSAGWDGVYDIHPILSFYFSCFIFMCKGFSTKTLENKESKCISNCAEKYLKLTQRIGYRFSEAQAAQADNINKK